MLSSFPWLPIPTVGMRRVQLQTASDMRGVEAFPFITSLNQHYELRGPYLAEAPYVKSENLIESNYTFDILAKNDEKGCLLVTSVSKV